MNNFGMANCCGVGKKCERGVDVYRRRREAAALGGSGAHPPPENFDILDALRRVLEHFQVRNRLSHYVIYC